jgi:hypothetical protein
LAVAVSGLPNIVNEYRIANAAQRGYARTPENKMTLGFQIAGREGEKVGHVLSGLLPIR